MCSELERLNMWLKILSYVSRKEAVLKNIFTSFDLSKICESFIHSWKLIILHLQPSAGLKDLEAKPALKMLLM